MLIKEGDVGDNHDRKSDLRRLPDPFAYLRRQVRSAFHTPVEVRDHLDLKLVKISPPLYLGQNIKRSVFKDFNRSIALSNLALLAELLFDPSVTTSRGHTRPLWFLFGSTKNYSYSILSTFCLVSHWPIAPS